MDLFEDSTHSFVVKISIKKPAAEGDSPEWQGQVTHVSSGTQYFFNRLEKMEIFFKTYLQEIILPPKEKSVWQRWLHRPRQRPTDD